MYNIKTGIFNIPEKEFLKKFLGKKMLRIKHELVKNNVTMKFNNLDIMPKYLSTLFLRLQEIFGETVNNTLPLLL